MSSLRTACLFAAATALAASAVAQSPPTQQGPASVTPPPIPANATPPPMPANSASSPSPARPAPPPPDVYRESDPEPQVTILHKDAETVEEVRVNGELRYVRVTPRGGKTYYLVPSSNGKNFIRYDSLGSNLSVPMWLLFSW